MRDWNCVYWKLPQLCGWSSTASPDSRQPGQTQGLSQNERFCFCWAQAFEDASTEKAASPSKSKIPKHGIREKKSNKGVLWTSFKRPMAESSLYLSAGAKQSKCCIAFEVLILQFLLYALCEELCIAAFCGVSGQVWTSLGTNEIS